MSIKNIVTCDGCSRPMGQVPHISLQFGSGNPNGVALPPNYETEDHDTYPNWQTVRPYDPGIKHFHNGECAKKFLDKMMKDVIGVIKK